MNAIVDRYSDEKCEHFSDQLNEYGWVPMGKIFCIADCHFGAEDVIRVFKRPFMTVKEMDRVMIENWNRAVGDNDTVISVGDFTYDKKTENGCSPN